MVPLPYRHNEQGNSYENAVVYNAVDDIMPNMTVCIAALADKGKKVVAGTDNMLTHTIGGTVTYEVETPTNKKMRKVADHTVIMGAGVSDNLNVVINEAKINGSDQPKKVAEKLRDSFLSFWKKSQEEVILIPLGLNWDKFTNHQNNLQEFLVKEISLKLQNHHPIGEFVVAGYDTHLKEGYICVISAGTILDKNTSGVAFAGGGMPLAQFSMIKSKHSKEIEVKEVEKMVIEAIEDSSHANGVGGKGDIVILGEE